MKPDKIFKKYFQSVRDRTVLSHLTKELREFTTSDAKSQASRELITEQGGITVKVDDATITKFLTEFEDRICDLNSEIETFEREE